MNPPLTQLVRRLALVLVPAVTLLAGCASDAKMDAISFNLAASSDGQPAAYFELSDAGVLKYSLGPQASALPDNLAVAGTLTREQRQQLVGIVHEGNLIDAKGDSPFIADDKVTYHLTLRTAEGTRRLTASDAQVPGVKKFYDAVFRLYCDLRYGAKPETAD